MHVWRTIFAVAIVTLWVTAGSHCRLEILPGFEFLSCCQHVEADKSPAHHEKDCGDDGCAAVEGGSYQKAELQQATPKPSFLLVAWVVPLPAASQVSAQDSAIDAASSPPAHRRVWQFFQRTALPPRAPSFVS